MDKEKEPTEEDFRFSEEQQKRAERAFKLEKLRKANQEELTFQRLKVVRCGYADDDNELVCRGRAVYESYDAWYCEEHAAPMMEEDAELCAQLLRQLSEARQRLTKNKGHLPELKRTEDAAQLGQ